MVLEEARTSKGLHARLDEHYKQDTIRIHVHVEYATRRAVLIQTRGRYGLWIPRSQIMRNDHVEQNYVGELIITRWIALKKRLI